ncbi:YlbF family regulator [Alicyclobacillus curvatus]|nr:YlbF family regulator [Alicyclobacillus curvatus]
MNQSELWAETDELAELIIQSPEIVAFHEAEKQLKAHPRASQMMAELRELQGQVGDFQARKVPPKHYIHLLKNSESLLEELEKIPEVVAFQRAQQNVNDLLKSVTNRLAQAVLSGVADDDEDNRV